MTKDNIIRMALEAGLCDADGKDSDSIVITSHLERFANLVAAAEREACAKVCEEAHWSLDDRTEYAAAIRARGNND